jgi:pimeloyl-ACP methyl ester carboxylesterase
MPHTHWPIVTDPRAPSVDDVAFKSLYTKEHYDVLTNDGWSLVITRYKPVPQAFAQPLLGVPVLCVHGFSQNRHAWTSGEFVKNLLYFGLDVHLLELRGHGKSSIKHQHDRLENDGLPVPPDVDYGWTFDSYALFDVPAAIDAIKSRTGRSKIAYVGHSMGGMIGYCLAGLRNDISCLVTIGASAELGKDSYLLRAASLFAPQTTALVDTALASANLARKARHLVRKHVLRKPDEAAPREWKYKFVPMDWLFATIERMLTDQGYRWYGHLSKLGFMLFNPKHTHREGVSWILTRGTHAEPRGVIDQFARWIRNQEMILYKTGYDIKKNYKRIEIPLAIVFGDRDFIASMKSTSRIYRAAKSEYLLWRPVRGNSHIELTMGYDIRQVCYDIKNIIEYAEHAGEKSRSLPRREAPAKPN